MSDLWVKGVTDFRVMCIDMDCKRRRSCVMSEYGDDDASFQPNIKVELEGAQLHLECRSKT